MLKCWNKILVEQGEIFYHFIILSSEHGEIFYHFIILSSEQDLKFIISTFYLFDILSSQHWTGWNILSFHHFIIWTRNSNFNILSFRHFIIWTRVNFIISIYSSEHEYVSKHSVAFALWMNLSMFTTEWFWSVSLCPCLLAEKRVLSGFGGSSMI